MKSLSPQERQARKSLDKDAWQVKRSKRLAENRISVEDDPNSKKQRQVDHVVGYAETRFSLNGNAAEEPGTGMVVLEKKQLRPVLSILLMYLKKCAFRNAKFCRSTRNRAFKLWSFRP